MSILLLLDSNIYSGAIQAAPITSLAARTKTSRTYMARGRRLTVTAYSTVGVDDCLENLLQGTLHQKLTGEQLVEPIPREIKDWQIRLNLNI